tara:strand:- start:273 stop:467 length:195 start_codon:yes stop_codon:yes gene_type:complete
MKSISIFVLMFSFCMFYYWVNGGNFIRGAELGLTVGMAAIVSIVIALLININGEPKKSKGKDSE